MSPLFELFLKEVKLIIRRKSMLFFLFFLPLFFGAIFSSYTSAIPEGTPIAIVVGPNVSQGDVWAIMTLARTFSHPHLVPSLNEALEGLQREQYYVVIEVKRFNGLENGEYVVYYDRTMTPVASISENLLMLLESRLGNAKVEAVGINKRVTLPEFFLPGLLLFLAMVVGFELVSDNTISERGVLPRLQLAGAVGKNFAVRLLVMVLLVFVQTVIIFAVYRVLDVKVGLNPYVLGLLLLNTLLFALVGLLVTMLFRFEVQAKTFLHVLLGFLVFISGFFYPVGFFPEVLQRVARLIPTYYAGVLMRSLMFRPLNLALYTDYFAVELGSLVVLMTAIVFLYRRAVRWSIQ